MPELTSAQKRKAREVCRQRDGDRCSLNLTGCNNIGGDEYRTKAGRDFDLHHKDHNRENNPPDGSNHALACHACNCKENPQNGRRKPYFNKFNEFKNRYINKNERGWSGDREFRWEQERSKPATMKKNEDAEPVFRDKVEEAMKLYGIVTRKDLIDGCSEAANCSQSTGSRYLDKLCSIFGQYEYVGKDEQGNFIPVDSIGGYSGEIYVRKKL